MSKFLVLNNFRLFPNLRNYFTYYNSNTEKFSCKKFLNKNKIKGIYGIIRGLVKEVTASQSYFSTDGSLFELL